MAPRVGSYFGEIGEGEGEGEGEGVKLKPQDRMTETSIVLLSRFPVAEDLLG